MSQSIAPEALEVIQGSATVDRMPPRTEAFLAEVKEFCDQRLGRRSELARYMGVSRQTVTHLLKGRRNPTGEQVLAIQEYLRQKIQSPLQR